MKDYMSPDTPNRDRTFADRKAFVLAEQTLETAKALAEANAPKGPEPLATDAIVDPNWAKGRERQSIREAATASRRDAFLHALGELTYRALPLDEHEKAPHRATVLEQTKELAHSLIEHWDLSPAGRELMETASAIVNVERLDETVSLVEASVADGELGPMIEHVASEIEQRVIGAIVADRKRSERVESRLNEISSTLSGDAELDELRQRRTLKRTAPSLMESLYVANRRVLSEEAGREIAAEVLMIETVCQYTLIETLAAVGVMAMDKVDAVELARRLAARKG